VLGVPVRSQKARVTSTPASVSRWRHTLWTCAAGKILLDTVENSAQVEYEGLLLGLQVLLPKLLQQCQLSASDSADLVILVQGDCKTVISQMKGHAQSRHLSLSASTREHTRPDAHCQFYFLQTPIGISTHIPCLQFCLRFYVRANDTCA
jgi:hypothetical protein